MHKETEARRIARLTDDVRYWTARIKFHSSKNRDISFLKARLIEARRTSIRLSSPKRIRPKINLS